jgi:hypothetical protein
MKRTQKQSAQTKLKVVKNVIRELDSDRVSNVIGGNAAPLCREHTVTGCTHTGS